MVFRRPERLECSSNTEMDIQQIPSEAALYRAGCVEKLTQILDTNLVYVLAALAAIAFMGNNTHYTVLHFSHRWHSYVLLCMVRALKHRLAT